MSKETNLVSRREFLKDAGLVVGGATVGSAALLSACKNNGKSGSVTKYVCPLDSKEFDSLQALKDHYASAHEGVALPDFKTLNINGVDYSLIINDYWSLAWVLRETLGLYGTKVGCDMGQCGACTVIVDDKPMYACLLFACEMEGKKIRTVEGLADYGNKLNKVQQAFHDANATQCGFCTSGFLMAAQALIERNSSPSEDEVRHALSGHLCMCQNFKKTIEAVVAAGGK